MKTSNIKEKLKPDTPITCNITKNVTLHTSKYRLSAAGALSVLLLSVVLLNTTSFLNAEVEQIKLLYIMCIIGSLFAGIIVGFEFNLPSKLTKWLMRLMILLLPIGTMVMAECLNGVFIGNWTPLSKLYNCIFYALLYMAAFALTGNRRAPFLIINPIIYLLAVTNHYVMAFRGSPFLPIDLMYIKTAASVADTYEFTLDYQVIISTVMFVLMMSIAWKIKTPEQKLWKKIYYRAISGVLAAMILGGYFVSDAAVNAGIATPFFFDPTRGYKSYGVSLSFFMNAKYLTVKEPDGYAAEEIEDIVYKTIDKNNTSAGNASATKEYPNVICIMNETLSDLSVLGDFNTNKDYMPFLRNLTENTVKGNLYVSVIGGSTCNTEFEFLTGATTAFLPASSNPYSLYINRDLNNFTSTLANYGYSATAFHPFYKKNWNRVAVYEHLGFNNYIGLEDMLDELEDVYEKEGVLLRNFVSDTYDYETVIEMYEGSDKDAPFYVFNVTMQNHGGYSDPYDNFAEEIYLVDENGTPRTDYPETNQYLSLIYESDKAIKDLIEYFSKQEEPTVICIFGDHQPSIEDEFIYEILGTESANGMTAEQTQSRYCTPFYIWANYDIEERQIDKLSVNYLSSYLMDTIGMEMPAFNQYLLKLSETLPVINTIGYIDANNNYYNYGEETEYSKLISDYEKICYNYLFDESNNNAGIYQLAP